GGKVKTLRHHISDGNSLRGAQMTFNGIADIPTGDHALAIVTEIEGTPRRIEVLADLRRQSSVSERKLYFDPAQTVESKSWQHPTHPEGGRDAQVKILNLHVPEGSKGGEQSELRGKRRRSSVLGGSGLRVPGLLHPGPGCTEVECADK